MLLKYFAIFAVCFALLAFGLNRWKKKYGHTNRGKASGDTAPSTEGSGLPQYPKEEPKPVGQSLQTEQQIAKAVAAADKVYKASRSKTKGKGK